MNPRPSLKREHPKGEHKTVEAEFDPVSGKELNTLDPRWVMTKEPLIPASEQPKPSKSGKYPTPPIDIIHMMVDWTERYLHLERKPPTVSEMAQYTGLTENHVYQLCETLFTPFTIRLERRGLPSPRPNSREVRGVNAGLSSENWLTPQQVAAVNCITNFYDQRPPAVRLEDMGVSPQKFRGWLDDPAFHAYLLSRSESSLRNHIPSMHRKVVELAEAGDMKAIKLFYTLAERLSNQPKVAVTNQTTHNHVSSSETFTKLVEAVQRHVKDPEMLKAIAGEFDQLTSDPNPSPPYTGGIDF